MYIYIIIITCVDVYYDAKGVNKSKRNVNKKGIHFNVRSNYNNFIVKYRNKKTGKGVRVDHHHVIVCKSTSTRKINMLKYRKPCVCGSLQHRKSTHPDCPVNDQYNDVIEK